MNTVETNPEQFAQFLVQLDEQQTRYLARLQAQYHHAVIKERTLVFVEAFSIMQYESTEVGKRTHLIWNTRNGVTSSCIFWDGHEYKHNHWGKDRCDTRHIPAVGDLVFVDYTPEVVLERTLARVAREWDGPGAWPMRKRWSTRWAAVVDLSKATYESGVPPHLVQVTDAMSDARGWTQRRAAEPERQRGQASTPRTSPFPPSPRFA